MRRIYSFLCSFLALCLLGCAQSAAETPVEVQKSFQELVGWEKLEEKRMAGLEICSAEYSDGYGFSDSGFETGDPGEIQALLDALAQIRVEKPTNLSVTDWYPSLCFRYTDGSSFSVRFNKHWLDVGGRNYELSNDEAFWNLTAQLVEANKMELPEADMHEDSSYPVLLSVYLPVEADSDFRWYVEIEDESLLELEEMFFADSREVGMDAEGGVQWFCFRGVEPGTTTVTLEYSRFWEEGTESRCAMVYRLDVDQNGSILVWGFELHPGGESLCVRDPE